MTNLARSISFTGTVTTVNPVTVSYYSSVSLTNDNNTTRMKTMGRNGPIVIQGSTIKRLCRTGSFKYLNHIGSIKQLRASDLQYLLAGGNKGSGKELPQSPVDELIFREENPFISIYGANQPFFTEGKIKVGMMFHERDENDKEDVLWLGGVRKDPAKSSEFLDVVILDEKDDQLRAAKYERIQFKTVFDKNIEELNNTKAKMSKADWKDSKENEDLTKLEHRLKELNDTIIKLGGSDVNEQMVFEYQAIPANRSMHHTIDLAKPTAIEFGLFLNSLQILASDGPFIGGHIGTGLGGISMDYNIDCVHHDRSVERLGSISIKHRGGYGSVEYPTHPLITEALTAWDRALVSNTFKFIR